MQKNTNSGGILIFGFIAIVALIIAWTAFNRSGEDLAPTVAQETEELAQETEAAAVNAANEVNEAADEAAEETAQAAARAEARAELLAIEARVEAGVAADEVAEDVAAVQANLEAAYEGASAEARAEYNELAADLSNLEDDVRNGTGDAIELFAELFLMLEADVRTDEDEMTTSVDANASAETE